MAYNSLPQGHKSAFFTSQQALYTAPYQTRYATIYAGQSWTLDLGISDVAFLPTDPPLKVANSIY